MRMTDSYLNSKIRMFNDIQTIDTEAMGYCAIIFSEGQIKQHRCNLWVKRYAIFRSFNWIVSYCWNNCAIWFTILNCVTYKHKNRITFFLLKMRVWFRWFFFSISTLQKLQSPKMCPKKTRRALQNRINL